MYVPVFLVLLAVISIIYCQGICHPDQGRHSCFGIQPKTDLDFKKYAGTWIDYLHSADQKYKCGYSVYDYKTDNSQKSYISNFTASVDGKTISETGKFKLKTCSGSSNVSYMKYSADELKLRFHKDYFDIYVIDTDYENYSVEYGCTYIDARKTVYAAVYGRIGVSPLDLQKVKDIVKSLTSDQKVTFVSGRDDNCPNY